MHGLRQKSSPKSPHTIGQALHSIWQRSGVMPKELTPPPCLYSYLFEYHEEIAIHGRDYGMGVAPIKWSELLAYNTMFGGKLNHLELSLIMKIDRTMLELENETK